MFNFFEEIKKKVPLGEEIFCDFNIVFMSGRLLYVEGHRGLTVLSSKTIVFKVKKGRITVDGEDLVLTELTENTILIEGKIAKLELL